VPSAAPDVAEVRSALDAVTDPEIPVVTIADLGILRDVAVAEDGAVEVTITPTYSGCPAMQEITADVQQVLSEHGWTGQVHLVLSPAWTTDWITERGREALRRHGIAPPGPRTDGPVLVQLGRPTWKPACPLCGSTDTEETSRFSSTSCKSLWRCRSCREPFDHFKSH
jgi:ring-1,2-phenylacetyl-CoA epoxidase subunit PaaD